MKLGARNLSQQVSGAPGPGCRDGRAVSWDPPGRSRRGGGAREAPTWERSLSLPRGCWSCAPSTAPACTPCLHPLPAPPCLHRTPPANHGDCQQPGCQELLYLVSVLPSGAGAPVPRTGRAGAAGAGRGASPRTSGSSRRRDGTGWERPQNGSSRCRPPRPGLGCAWKGRTQRSVQDERPCPQGEHAASPQPPQMDLCSPAPAWCRAAGAVPCLRAGLGAGLTLQRGDARPAAVPQAALVAGGAVLVLQAQREALACSDTGGCGGAEPRPCWAHAEGAGEGAALPSGVSPSPPGGAG